MIILCDSREQNSLAWEFDHLAIDWVQICALPFADYWCVFQDGHIVPFVFERKDKKDFFGSFGGRYDNEKKKLIKCHKEGMLYKVILECPLKDVLKGYKYSNSEGISLARTMFTWNVKYNVETIYCSNRKEMAIYIAESFFAYGKTYKPKKKKNTNKT